MTVLDYILVIIVAWGGLKGWVRGMLSIIIGFAGLLLAWYLAARYAGTGAQWLDHSLGWLTATARYFAGRVPLPAALAGQSLVGLKPEDITALVAKLPFPTVLQGAVLAAAKSAFLQREALHLTTVGDLVYYSLAALVWTAIAFFVIMAVITGVARTVAWQATRSLEGTPLSLVNHLAGLALGAAESLVVLVILGGLLVPLLHLVRWPALQQALTASQLLPYLEAWFRRWSPWQLL